MESKSHSEFCLQEILGNVLFHFQILLSLSSWNKSQSMVSVTLCALDPKIFLLYVVVIQLCPTSMQKSMSFSCNECEGRQAPLWIQGQKMLNLPLFFPIAYLPVGFIFQVDNSCTMNLAMWPYAPRHPSFPVAPSQRKEEASPLKNSTTCQHHHFSS